MIIRLIIVLLALTLVFGGIFGWKYYQAQSAQTQQAGPPPAVIAATEPQIEHWQPVVKAVGTLTAGEGVYVTTEVAGQVQRIHFESGQRVTEGDILVQLDASSDRAELDALIAERSLAQIRFDRTARLLKENSVSRSAYDEARAELDVVSARVAAKQAMIEKKTVRAPFSGQMGIRQVDRGQYLTPGTRIVNLQSSDPIYTDFTLPERHLDRLETGQATEVRVRTFPDRTFSGHISAIEPTVEQATRNVRVRATLPNSGRELRPGMFAEIRVVTASEREVLTLPRTAITYAPYGDSVFVIEEQDDGSLIARQRQVTTGEVRDRSVEIVSGVEPGIRVVSAGQVKLRNGQPVTIDNSVELSRQADAQ